MDNNKHTQDFDLEDILKEFGSGKPLPKTEEPEAKKEGAKAEEEKTEEPAQEKTEEEVKE